MQGESSIQENSEPPEDPQESTPQVEDPQDDMEKISPPNSMILFLLSKHWAKMQPSLAKLGNRSRLTAGPEETENFYFTVSPLLPRLLRLVPRQGLLYHLCNILSLGCCSIMVQTRALGTNRGTSNLAWRLGCFRQRIANQLQPLRQIRWRWKRIGQPPDERQPTYLRILGLV